MPANSFSFRKEGLQAQQPVVQPPVLEESGALGHEVAAAAEVDRDGHHQGPTVGVDGGVRHLRETLRGVV
eukprot:10797593-Lingulodinium_polyedra.AAC.1